MRSCASTHLCVFFGGQGRKHRPGVRVQRGVGAVADEVVLDEHLNRRHETRTFRHLAAESLGLGLVHGTAAQCWSLQHLDHVDRKRRRWVSLRQRSLARVCDYGAMVGEKKKNKIYERKLFINQQRNMHIHFAVSLGILTA